jgi:UDP-N-acetyl-D-mannosaminuronic acid transferase (WecB/TagA/CpsF family)
MLVSILGLCLLLGGTAGCTAKDETAWRAQERAVAERSDRYESLRDEESFADKVGQAGIAVLVVAVAIGAIVLPFLLF